MPQLSDTMTEGVLVSWEKNIGDAVKRGDIVATVETDKAVMDVEVFRDGFLSGPIAAIDAVVEVTGAIAYLVESQDDVVQGEAEQSAQPAVAATPAAAASAPASALAAGKPALASAAAPTSRPQGSKASPLARKLAAQQGVDLDRVSGSG
jgi:dihydrolipoamide dehydrogenase